MLSLKRGLLAAVAGVLAMLVMAVPSGAQSSKDVVTADCVFTGDADVTPPVRWEANKGTYEFRQLTFTCAGVEYGSKGEPVKPGVVELTVESDGFYSNLACGTGKAYDPAPVGKPDPDDSVPQPREPRITGVNVIAGGPSKVNYPLLAQQGKFNYVLEFAAGNGVLYWTNPDNGKVDAGATKAGNEIPQQTKPTTGWMAEGGEINITPDPLIPPGPMGTGPCTPHFDVEGELHIDI